MFWVFGQAFGEIMTGGATDPNSAPLLALLALAYWPARAVAPSRAYTGPARTEEGMAAS